MLLQVKAMRAEKIVTILIFAFCANSVFSQTEKSVLLIDSTKQIQTEQFVPQHSMENLIRNPYPAKLSISIDLHDIPNQHQLPAIVRKIQSP